MSSCSFTGIALLKNAREVSPVSWSFDAAIYVAYAEVTWIHGSLEYTQALEIDGSESVPITCFLRASVCGHAGNLTKTIVKLITTAVYDGAAE